MCYCKNIGHIKTKCYKLHNKNKRDVENDEKGNQKAEVADVSVDEDRGNDFLLLFASESSKLTSE